MLYRADRPASPASANSTKVNTIITLCGGCHIDRHLFLADAAKMGRTNPASRYVRLGGVVANMARHLCDELSASQVHVIGVKPANAQDHDNMIERLLDEAGLPHTLVPLEGETPEYVAVIDANGELVIGAAETSLYDKTTPETLLPHLNGRGGALVIDANFPAPTLAAVARAWPEGQQLFAAATSTKKAMRLEGCLERLDAIVMNRDEAAALCGRDGPVDEMALALSARMRRRSAVVLISDGAEQATLVRGGETVRETPPDIDVVNANGAGDVMAAELFARLVSGDTAIIDVPPGDTRSAGTPDVGIPPASAPPADAPPTSAPPDAIGARELLKSALAAGARFASGASRGK